MKPFLSRITRLAGNLSRESDGALLGAFLAGNQVAFRELVERHESMVFGVCQRVLRHRQDSEDAFQAVFIVLARRAADVWPRDAVGSWLYGVATRVALKARTLRQRRLIVEGSSAVAFVKKQVQREVSSSDFDTVEAIDRAVRKLPEVYRAAVVACDLEGLSRKDAASQLGWTEGTLSGRLSRARKLLAERLRKAGVTCPAIGLATLLGLESSSRAGLSEKVMKVALSSSGIPAAVDSLTHGVVQSMFAFKIKTAAVAVLIASTLGLGAWTAGAGDDPGSKGSQVKASPQLPVPTGPEVDLARIRSELKAIEQEVLDLQIEIQAAGGNPPEQLKKRIRLAEDKLVELRGLLATGREPGKLTALQAPVKVDPAKLDPGLKELQGKWKIEKILDGKNELPWDWKGQQFVEFVGSSITLPYREGDGTLKRNEYKVAVDASRNPKTIDLIQPNKPMGQGIYEFLAPATTCGRCHKNPLEESKEERGVFVPCKPGRARATELRLALASTIQRPTKFGGNEGVIEFQLSRIVQERLPVPPQSDQTRNASIEALKLRLLLNEAAAVEAEARARLAKAQADLEHAKEMVHVARRNAEEARASLALLENPPVPTKPQSQAGDEAASFSVHIRTLYSPEKIVRVKSTGTQTVLEGLAYAAEDMTIKPEAISVWVIREKGLLAVDLAGIIQKGDSKTNLQLKPGDQLFVQVKVAK